ncbi:MAG TPA: M20/M25/M40 family metallo-hydrolase [Gemmatimonadaceae bacterium]|nr:M20/M25/M40 family metallo-hydrolase [Gemmatimonadaceae bacterium]
MLSESSLAFLRRLLDAHGPSGFETRPAGVWREEARTFAAVGGDVAGNSTAVVHPDGAPTIMLAGHIDEIGVIVTWIDDDGFVHIGAIGGWDPQVLVGQRIRFLGREGDVVGVVGRKPIHLLKRDERDQAAKITDLWVDVGAASRAEALQRLDVGDPGVIDAPALAMPNDRLVSRAIDDRIGAFVVLEALRRYAERPGHARVVAVATTQEEIGHHGGGALISASRLGPAMAIAVDVTHATDHPSAEKKETGEHRLGGGPVLARGSLISPVVYRLIREAAARLEIPVSVQAVGGETSTDADFIHLAREGVATALVSVPNRYMHSPGEMVSLLDVDRLAALLAEVCRAVTPDTDFTAR